MSEPPSASDPLWWPDELLAAATEDELDAYERALRAELADLDMATRPLPESPGALAAELTGDREMQAPHLNLLDQAYIDLSRGTIDRLIVEAPPRHGKSRRLCRWGPLWYFRHHPDHQLAVASYGASLAQGHARFVRDMLRDRWAEVGLRLARAHGAVYDFAIDQHAGGMIALGVRGPYTGKGSHGLIVDDPHKDRAEAESKDMRKAVREWFSSTAIPRLEPGGWVVVSMQRWHDDDLVGYLLDEEGREDEGGRWRVITLRALSEHGRVDPETGQADVDPLGRPEGEPLWPERYDAPALEALRITLGPYNFASQYQQRPQPREGGLWNYATIRRTRVRFLPADVGLRVVAVDPSGGERDTSDEAGIVVAGRDSGGEVFVLEDLSGRMSPEGWGRAGLLAALRWQAGTVVYEANYGGDMVRSVIDSAWRQLTDDLRLVVAAVETGSDPYALARPDGEPVPDVEALLELVAARTRGESSWIKPAVAPVRAKVNKVLRAEPVSQVHFQGRVHHVGTFPELEAEQTSYRQGSTHSPNRLDAFVYAVTFLEDPSAVGELRTAAPSGQVPKATVGGRRSGVPVTRRR